ncbi:hypothetical protein JYQ62_05800 [Nostoc sp. UHCC 0702]|nr:hypothetical protein JYQ62_05800 [Nostoc sp. UHCC 0702]
MFFKDKLYRPWLIVRILASTQAHTVARFANRQDAEDHMRVLHRFLPNAVFDLMFEPPDGKEPVEQIR